MRCTLPVVVVVVAVGVVLVSISWPSFGKRRSPRSPVAQRGSGNTTHYIIGEATTRSSGVFGGDLTRDLVEPSPITKCADSAAIVMDPGSWRVIGRVTDTTGRAVHEADVRLTLRHSADEHVLADVRSGRDGEFEADVTLLRDRCYALRNSFQIWGRARAGGHDEGIVGPLALPPSESECADIEMNFALADGAVVHGRIVDASGRPARGALVESTRVGATTDRASRATDVEVKFGTDVTTTDGRFAIPIERSGRYRIDVQARGVGVGSVGSIDLVPSADFQVPLIVLDTGESIEGFVRHPDQCAAVGFGVHAIRQRDGLDGVVRRVASWFTIVDTDDRPDGSWSDIYGFAEDIGGRAGFREGRAVTGPDGEFQLRGLEPGTYRVTAADASVVCASGTRNVTLETEPRPDTRLRVRVSDDVGRPLAGVAILWFVLAEQQDCMVFQTDETRAPDGVAERSAAPGGRYFVSAIADGFDGAEARVEVLHGQEVTDIDLVLRRSEIGDRPKSVSGVLRVSAVDDSGYPIFGMHGRLTSGASGKRVHFTTSDDADSVVTGIAPGAYTLDATYGREPFNVIFGSRSIGLQIANAGETCVVVRTSQGGRIRMTVRVPFEVGDDELVLERVEACARGGDSFGTPIANVWDDRGGRWRPVRWLAAAVAAVAQPLLVSGPHDLYVCAHGFKPLQLPIEITAGETTDVDVFLERQ